MNIKPSKLDFIHPKLSEILEWAEYSTGLTFNTSSIYRPGDNGVHGQLPVRGYDTSCRARSIGEAIAAHVNAHWTYDPARPSKPVCFFHDEQGPHIHWQVHPNTERRQ